ncbi:MAG TPA: YlmH/Sll1252 family protein [Bacillota bacterium]|nr:YlmH/Sll1252 family protein [Bacillota bacterium]
MNEDEALLAGIEDKITQCIDNYMVTNSSFLDMRQRTLAEARCRKHKGFRWCFYGGYEDAERTVAVFLPDYAELADNDPLALLRMTPDGRSALTHRDYLGSLMGLGVKREMIGDILVREKGADIVIMKDMGDFLLYHYGKAGRTSLKAEITSIDQIIVPENRVEEKRDTVASLRLDNLVSSSFSLSRGKAAEAIESGLVFVNGMQSLKTDRQMKEGDKLVLRGKGKVLLKEVGGVTRKDRTYIVLDKYI